MARAWGIWSQYKLQLLERYLDAFTTATKSVTSRVYLDLFGGEPDNVAKDSLEPIDGSARIALDTSNPPFTHLRFFEMGANAAKLRATIAAEYSDRDAVVYEGDCNETVREALADLLNAGVGWAPTFAFIDPNGPHYRWPTLAALADHKPADNRTKVELWMLFPDPLFVRLLPTTGDLRPEDDVAITDMFGTAQWHAIWQARLRELIAPGDARTEYVNLMRWRLEHLLRYKWTHQLEIRTERNAPIYHMIFATDSEPGERIMKYLYEKAAGEYPDMLATHRAMKERMSLEEKGHYDLFSGSDIDVPYDTGKSQRATLPIDPPDEPRTHDATSCPYCQGRGAN